MNDLALSPSLICGVLSLGSAIYATVAGDTKRSILSLWFAGLSVGGLYLSWGAEFLAVLQWILSTLVAISFLFYAVMFGEYGAKDPRSLKKRITDFILPGIFGALFTAVISVGAPPMKLAAGPEQPTPAIESPGLASLGKTLVEQHFLSLELLAFTLFLTLVGSGVIARAERKERLLNEQDSEGSA